MNCPLPIDWLDYLEGREVQVDADLDAHLAGCRRCQALVAALKERSVGRMLAPYQGAPLSLAPKWPKSTKEEASAGQIWLTLESGTEYASLSRQLVLVLGARPEFGTTWFSVAPLTTETELATSTDLLLGPKDTTLVVPLSVHFRLQAPLAREQLRAYVGETTESGRALIGEASRGTLIQEHFGSAVVRNGDTRLRRLKPMRESIAMLGSVYDAALMTAEEEAEELADADQPSARADLVTASK